MMGIAALTAGSVSTCLESCLDTTSLALVLDARLTALSAMALFRDTEWVITFNTAIDSVWTLRNG